MTVRVGQPWYRHAILRINGKIANQILNMTAGNNPVTNPNN
jgi:hypothetical protein